MSGTVTLHVKNPTGVVRTIQSHAKRLNDLNGKVIGELSNGVWEDQRIFPAIRETLLARFLDLKIIPFTEFPIGTEQIDRESVIDRLLQKGCQAVIVGNAA